MAKSGLEVLAIIPARAGSKGVPGKNLKSLGGKALIEWTFIEALKSKLVEKMIVHRGHLFYLESGATIAEKNRVLHRVKLN